MYRPPPALRLRSTREAIRASDAADPIAGYTIMNDVSMRDWQYRSLQWFAGKNFEHSTPVEPGQA